MRYVARHPAEAGLCARPADWRWSSYGATIGLEPALRLLDVDRLLGLFGSRRHVAREEFARLLEGPELLILSDQAKVARIDRV